MRFDLDMPAWKWPFYVARHPFEGFEDVRWKKAYNSKVALIIVLCLFIVTVAARLMTGFIFQTNFEKVFNVVPLFSSSVIIFFIWVVGNWSLCTLFNGEGKMQQIMCVTAYALVPYIISQIVYIFASNILTRQEGTILTFISYIGIVWSAVLIISAMKAVHQYTMPKTILAILFTIVAMVIIILVLILLISLFQQVVMFVYSIYTELMYRFSMS
ncbi:MAG: YIP1 family protein [Ruminococcaceae bacterium]|nr:YIP1 family protein [Oscillospiraceae bacterium]